MIAVGEWGTINKELSHSNCVDDIEECVETEVPVDWSFSSPGLRIPRTKVGFGEFMSFGHLEGVYWLIRRVE